MTVTAEQTGLFAALRDAGASWDEAIIVLGIVGELEAIELAHSDAWRHELRGKGGRFARTPGMGGHDSVAGRNIRRQNRLRQHADPAGPVARPPDTSAATAVPAELAPSLKIPEVARINAASPAPLTHEHVEIGKMISEVRQAHADYVKAADVEESKKARMKFLGVFTSLIAGVIASLISARLGGSDIATALAGVGPAALESLYELKNRL